jgi:hypothetical protein
MASKSVGFNLEEGMARVGDFAETLNFTTLVGGVGEVLVLPTEPEGLRLLVVEMGEVWIGVDMFDVSEKSILG